MSVDITDFVSKHVIIVRDDGGKRKCIYDVCVLYGCVQFRSCWRFVSSKNRSDVSENTVFLSDFHADNQCNIPEFLSEYVL